VSPDQHWIAYVKHRDVWLRSARSGRSTRLTKTGKGATNQYFSIEAFLVGFTTDSKQLIYSVAPGKDECPDCKRSEIVERRADYGFFVYDLRSHRPRRLQVPESTRISGVVSGNRFVAAKVGDYGDQLGLLELPSQSFHPFPSSCASADGCRLTTDGHLATCTQIGNDHSQVVECETQSEQECNVSPLGDCINEFQQPSRSPAATHLAYFQIPDKCRGPNRVLWVDQKPVFQCFNAHEYTYGWIDDNRLLVECEQEFVVVDIEGSNLGSIRMRP
jgi:hypothetical protein